MDLRHAGIISISSRVLDGIIKPVPIFGGRIDKSVTVFFASTGPSSTPLILAFSVSSISTRIVPLSPHTFKTRSEDSAMGKKLVETGDGVKAIDGDSILSIEAVVGPVT